MAEIKRECVKTLIICVLTHPLFISQLSYPRNEINTPAATAEPMTPEILLDIQ